MKDELSQLDGGELIYQPTGIIPEGDESVKVLRLSHRYLAPISGRMGKGVRLSPEESFVLCELMSKQLPI